MQSLKILVRGLLLETYKVYIVFEAELYSFLTLKGMNA